MLVKEVSVQFVKFAENKLHCKAEEHQRVEIRTCMRNKKYKLHKLVKAGSEYSCISLVGELQSSQGIKLNKIFYLAK